MLTQSIWSSLLPRQQRIREAACARGWGAGAWEPGSFPRMNLRQGELCPPSALRLGRPSARSLWPELTGTGRPGPPPGWPTELFWGMVIDDMGTRLDSEFKRKAGAGAG